MIPSAPYLQAIGLGEATNWCRRSVCPSPYRRSPWRPRWCRSAPCRHRLPARRCLRSHQRWIGMALGQWVRACASRDLPHLLSSRARCCWAPTSFCVPGSSDTTARRGEARSVPAQSPPPAPRIGSAPGSGRLHCCLITPACHSRDLPVMAGAAYAGKAPDPEDEPMHVIRRRGWEIPARLATPERLFLNRRGFLAGTGLAALALSLPADTALRPARQRSPRIRPRTSIPSSATINSRSTGRSPTRRSTPATTISTSSA